MSADACMSFTCDACQKRFSSPKEPSFRRFKMIFPDYLGRLYLAACDACFQSIAIPFSIQRLRAINCALIKDEMATTEYPEC